MMKDLRYFTNGSIDLPIKVNKDDSIMFDAEQAAIGLGLTDTSKGTIKVRWKRVNDYLSATSGAGHYQKIAKGDFITEPQFYKLAIKANNETAEIFQDWVTSEVLPSIRKHGAYMTSETIKKVLLNPDTIIQIATQLKTEQEKNRVLTDENAKMKPKALYTDKMLSNPGLESTTMIAKNYGMSTMRFNSLLKELHIQYRQGGTWVLYSKYQDKGYTHIEPFQYVDRNGLRQLRNVSKWTQRGQKFLYDLLQANDIFPLIEQIEEV